MRPALLRPALAALIIGGALVPLATAEAWSGEPLLFKAVALVAMTMLLLASGVVPSYVAAALFFLFAAIFDVGSDQAVFSGFASGALWLVFGGMLIGGAIYSNGLGARLARGLMPLLGRRYGVAVTMVVGLALALAFLMPSSMGRVVLLVPLAMAIADSLGLETGRPGRTGIVLAAGIGSFLPPFAVLPANIPNLVLMGAAQSLHGIELTFAHYLLVHFPLLGLGKAVVLAGVLIYLFPDRIDRPPHSEARRPMTGPEWRLAGLLAIAIALWATDFIHGISPAWVGLGVGLLCLMPAVSSTPLTALGEKVDFGVFLYVAAIVSVGAVVAEAGATPYLSRWMIDGFGLSPGAGPGEGTGAGFFNFVVLGLSGSALGLVSTLPGISVLLTPIAESLGAATGMSLIAVLMTQVVGFSTVWLPYQAPPLMVAARIGGIGLAAMSRCTLIVAVLTVLFLIPLDYLWWRLIGLI